MGVPDIPAIKHIKTNSLRTFLQGIIDSDPDREWRMLDTAHYVGLGGAGPVLVGAPEQIADKFEH